jgi:hypothetical protein
MEGHMQQAMSRSTTGEFTEVKTSLGPLGLIQANYEAKSDYPTPISIIDATALRMRALAPHEDCETPEAPENQRWLAGRFFKVRGGVVALWFPEPVSPGLPIGSIRVYTKGNVRLQAVEEFLEDFDMAYYEQKFVINRPRDRPMPEPKKRGSNWVAWLLIGLVVAVIVKALATYY